MSSADSLDREENSMEVRTCISKPHAIFIFYLARTSIERVSSDRRGTSTTGQTTCPLAPSGFTELVHAESLLNYSGLSFSNAAARRSYIFKWFDRAGQN